MTPFKTQAQCYIEDCDSKFLAGLHARSVYVYTHAFLHAVYVLGHGIYLL